MKALKFLASLTLLVVCLCISAAAQSPAVTRSSNDESVAAVFNDSTQMRWEPRAGYERLILTVSTPGGRVFRKEFKSGKAPSFDLVDDKGNPLPDGQYNYELSAVPRLDPGVKETLRRARGDGDGGEEVVRELRAGGLLPAEPLTQSGSFVVYNGSIIKSGLEEPRNPDATGSNGLKKQKGANGSGGEFVPQDQVIADDLIVQGSACVGLDCVNNETFGFDTIRLKENNTRIKFEDTSTSSGFPSNDWQLTANDSASGGANKFSIDDVTGAKTPFTITAGAPTNSVFVSSSGFLGLGTTTPVLKVHAKKGDTPGMRLEQDGSGGFTPYTWDVAGNEANFFVRDVTGGSLLPFRIFPHAPTDSLDVAASGNIGVGTLSPSERVHMFTSGASDNLLLRMENGTRAWSVGINGASDFWRVADNTVGAARFVIANTGNIGLGGVTNPTSPIQHTNGATLSAGGVWTNASSRALKINIHTLSSRDAFFALQRMDPVTFQYKANPGEKHVGFIAEDVPDLVATSDRKGLSPMDVVAVLTKVVQEQQQMIVELKKKVARLERMTEKPGRVGRTKKNLSRSAIR